MKLQASLLFLIFQALLASIGHVAAQEEPVLPHQAPAENGPSPSVQSPAPVGLPGVGATTPGTSSPTTPTQPEGLNQSGNDVMGQDLLTGNWGGFRDTLQHAGVKLSPTYIGELFGNPTGGAKQGVIYDGLLNVALDLDLQKMGGETCEGVTFHANALWIHGPGLSNYYVGDFSNTSNIAAYNTVRLDELWMQDTFWQQRLSLKVGNMAVDNEFFQSASASLFINGTFGAFTFIASNLPNAPVYPLASPGIRLQFVPTSNFYVMAGVYGQDLNSDPTINNKNGTRFALNATSGVLVMSEAGYLLHQSPNDLGLQGTYRIGSFLHSDDAQTFAGESGGTNYGVYAVMDQQIYSKADKVISLFVRGGGAPENTNFVDYYIEGGFDFSGFVPGRESDVAGLAVARSHVSDDFSTASLAGGGPSYTAETVIEATYKAQIAPWWSVQPDVQYIITPGGFSGANDALVLGVRSTVAF